MSNNQGANKRMISRAEAMSWLQNNKNESAFATNTFQNTRDAIEAVRRIYDAGAILVEVIGQLEEPWRIREEGGPYADALEITVPEQGREKLKSVLASLKPNKIEEVAERTNNGKSYLAWIVSWD